VRLGLPLGMSLYLAFSFLDPGSCRRGRCVDNRALVGVILTCSSLTFTDFFASSPTPSPASPLWSAASASWSLPIAFPPRRLLQVDAPDLDAAVRRLRFMYALQISWPGGGLRIVALVFSR
jgi:hypothetical protein